MIETKWFAGGNGDIRFGEYDTRYMGRRERVLAVSIDDEEIRLKLGDTQRCARTVEDCRATLRSLADLVGADPERAAREAEVMLGICRTMTGWVEKPKRDRPRARPVRIRV